MRRLPPPAVLALGALLGSVAIVAAWAVDARAHEGDVLPNVHLAGHEIRGMSEDSLGALVDDLARQYAAADVEIRTEAGGFGATVPELGVALDVPATVEEALRAGREGAAPRRLWDWVRSFVAPIELPVVIDVDRAQLDALVAERDPSREPAAEPFFVLEDGRLEGREGSPGEGADPDDVARSLRKADPGEGRIVLEPGRAPVPPRFSAQDVDRLAAGAERLADGLVTVQAGGETAVVPAETFRLWVHAVPTADRLRLGIKASADVVGDLVELLPTAGTPPVNAGFTVSGDGVQVVEGTPGMLCCGDEARTIIDQAVATADGSRPLGPIELPLREVQPERDAEEARSLGITEVIGTFTTKHAPGEPRVHNIQRMADLLRGTVIGAGQTFSINGAIGPRTTGKGFVSAPIIGPNNVLEADVGGGVSQFATTTFNAAFFAGLDITEYFMHTLYISRYPYGRESTLSFPAPDLKVRNNTPYGVLLWTSYTDTSITVTFYSTKYVVGEQTDQTVERFEPTFVPEELREDGEEKEDDKPLMCERFTTTRTRRFLDDGRTTTDRFGGVYSPAEGVRCR